MSRSAAPPNSTRAVPVPPIYYAIMGEVERTRRKFGISMWKVNEAAGTQEGYYARALYADTPTGRIATWPILQKIVDALFPDGVEVILKPWKGCLDASKHRLSIKFIDARYDLGARQDWMQELSKKGASKGGKARARKLPKRRRVAIARKAARKRWSAPKIVEVQAPQTRPVVPTISLDDLSSIADQSSIHVNALTKNAPKVSKNRVR